jgi:hypothetical protein
MTSLHERDWVCGELVVLGDGTPFKVFGVQRIASGEVLCAKLEGADGRQVDYKGPLGDEVFGASQARGRTHS